MVSGRLVTYNEASSAYNIVTARERYDELSERDLCAQTTAQLRERGEFDPQDSGHQLLARCQPLTVTERLEHMAAGEVLSRYYRHPAELDYAVKAGATWEQIGAARGTSADQARQDYREWASGQHQLYIDYDGKVGLSDADYAAAIAHASDPETYPGGIGDPANIGILADAQIPGRAERDKEAGQ